MALWNPYCAHDFPMMMHRAPHHMLAMADQLFDSLDSMFEIPSSWLDEPRQDHSLNNGRTMEIVNTNDQFKINLAVENFKPEELNVKCVKDRFVVIHGKHEEKKGKDDEESFIKHEFKRSFVVPKGVDLSNLKSSFSKEGVLTIEAPKSEMAIPNERVIAIEYEKAGGDKK